MIDTWLGTDWQQIWLVIVSGIAIFAGVVLIARLNGLRSFSKMSNFDFAVTVATGSVMASVAASSTSLANGFLALVVLFGCQRVVAAIRRRTAIGPRVFDNQALLLMRDGEFLQDHLTRARVTEADVRAKLREANVLRLDEIRAVVLETTGDVSVLHGDGPVDDFLLEDVLGSGAYSDP